MRMENSIYYSPKEYRELQKRTDRRSQQYNQWKYFILKRDHFRCVECGLGDDLNVHHIERYSERTDKRIKKKNGITLCHECHTKKHEWMHSHPVIVRKAPKTTDGLMLLSTDTRCSDPPRDGITDETATFLKSA